MININSIYESTGLDDAITKCCESAANDAAFMRAGYRLLGVGRP